MTPVLLTAIMIVGGPSLLAAGDPQVHAIWSRQYPAEQFLVGSGQGDLSKGRLVCQRVSEIAARADVAKQIRILVKERAVDRVRERTGAPVEQDIEIVREESVNEYLQDVKIVDRRVDEAAGTCSSVAVMAKNRVAPKPGLPIGEPQTPP
jgi:hypothetical protein